MCRDDDDNNDNDTDHRTGGPSLGENSCSRPRQLYHIYSSISPINDDGIIGIARSPILARCKSAICWPQCWWLTPCRPV